MDFLPKVLEVLEKLKKYIEYYTVSACLLENEGLVHFRIFASFSV